MENFLRVTVRVNVKEPLKKEKKEGRVTDCEF